MSEKEREFDALVNLHSEVKSFKIDNSAKILKNFRSTLKDQSKFKLTAEETEEKPRLNLSSTTVCAYALSQYLELWDENGKPEYKSEFKFLKEYYEFIINEGFKKYLESNSKDTSTQLESTDEFCLINILSLLKEYQEKAKKENEDFKEDDEVIIKIIRLLCKQFIKNRFSFREKPHPFLYYKFLRIMQDWAEEIVKDIEHNSYRWTKWNENGANEDEGLKSFVDKVKERKGDNKAIFDYFFNEAKIYDDAKYEMYRQIALYNAEDFSIFDVKRLIYSLLIVKLNDKYSNNLIKDRVLELIFKEQLKTGLFPIGHVVNTDFVIEEGRIKDKTERIKSASPMSPILSSVECLNDMLMHEELKTDLEKYQEKLNSMYEWIIKRLRKDSPDKPLGWFPEYESTHTPESWVAGHTLVFLKRYCKMLSELIEKNAGKELQAKKHDELDIEWVNLYDSYKIKEYMGNMMQEDKENEKKWVSNPEYRSALIFGPPGSGKTTIPKALAKKLGWHYVELIPGQFLSEGVQNIIPKANEIFKRLVRMKETVIFFDEVDQLVELRKDGTASSKWIVTSLLPKFQELRKQKEIKFILATNDITKVDPAVTRSGRIDFVLPMGETCWRDRLKILRDAIADGNKQIREQLNCEIFEDILRGNKLKDDEQIDSMEKNDIKKSYLQNFLSRTDFVPLLEIGDIVKEIFNKEEWEEIEKAELYKIFFTESEDRIEKFENSDFKNFHSNYSSKQPFLDYIKLPVKIRIKTDIDSVIKDNIFGKKPKPDRAVIRV